MARHRAPSAGSRALTTVTLTGVALGISMATLAGSALAATAPVHGAQPAEPLGEHPAAATPTVDHLHPHSRAHHAGHAVDHHAAVHHAFDHHAAVHHVRHSAVRHSHVGHSTPTHHPVAHHDPAAGTAQHPDHHAGRHHHHHRRHHRHHGGGDGLF